MEQTATLRHGSAIAKCVQGAARQLLEQLETAQLAVARAITNLLGTTPKEVVRHEANLQPLALRLRGGA